MTSAKVVEETEDYLIYEAECPADPTIKPRIRRKKEKKVNETSDIVSDIETESSVSESTPTRKRRK